MGTARDIAGFAGSDGSMCVAFRLKATMEHRHLAIRLVSAVLEDVAKTDLHFKHEMITAFGEAYNNIVIHGYRDRTDGILSVEADLDADQVTLRLIDDGIAIDFATVASPDLQSLPESGMGVYMMHALVDEVTYQQGDVNILSLTKRAAPSSGR